MDLTAVTSTLAGIEAVLGTASDVGERQGHLDDAHRRISTLESAHEILGNRLPVIDEYLDAALAATAGSADALVDGVRRLAPDLHWVRAYADLAPGDPVMDRFVANYAYTVIAGPSAERWPPSPVDVEHTVVGLTLQAPGIYYPAHTHLAVELYGVIGGAGAWKRGAADWVDREPGSAFVHVADESHAMETHEAPMLSWFVWLNHLDATVELA